MGRSGNAAAAELVPCNAYLGRNQCHGGSAGAGTKGDAHLRELDPGLRISNLRDLFPVQRPEDFARWEEGLRLAGLPE